MQPYYQKDDMTIYNGDVLEILPDFVDQFQLVFADPPFNVGKKYGANNDRLPKQDYILWCQKWMTLCHDSLRSTGVFWLMTIDKHLEFKLPYMAHLGMVFINLVKWRNVQAVRAPKSFWISTQPIAVYGKTEKYVFHHLAQTRKIADENLRWGGYTTAPKGQLLDYWDDIPFVYAGSIAHPEAYLVPGTNKKVHPAQMPTGLAIRAIEFCTNPGDYVLDPFMGSGTVGVACTRLGRKYVGIEINPDYCKLAVHRIEKEKDQGRMF